MSDAVRRDVEVVPDGVPFEQAASGTLSEPFEVTLGVPDDAIDGSVGAIVKLYPSSFSQLVEGLDAIFQMPYGCFEQTSSTTYPNVLALDYLRRTGKSVPEVEAKARQYIHVGWSLHESGLSMQLTVPKDCEAVVAQPRTPGEAMQNVTVDGEPRELGRHDVACCTFLTSKAPACLVRSGTHTITFAGGVTPHRDV